MKVWVSGARGFVGCWLVPHLAAAGHDVVSVDHEVDVRDGAAVDRSLAASRPDALVHLAAVASPVDARQDPARAARVNTLGTLHVLRAVARRTPDARVLLVGSGEVYGSAAEGAPPFTESAPLAPGSPYARTKAAADLLGAAFAARGLDVVRARPFNHTGPGQADAYVASSFARQLAEIELGRRPPVLAVGNLDAVRDFLDVSDVVEAYRRMLDPSLPPGAYNVASGVGTSIRALLDRLLAVAAVKPELHRDPARWRPATASVGDATRLRRAAGWAPRTPLEDTLARLIESWRRRLAASP